MTDPLRNVGDPPVVTGFTPNEGPVGLMVTVTGSNFTGATQVGFTGASAAFTVVNDSTITAVVPAGAQTGPISVSNPYGVGTSGAVFVVDSGGGGGGGGGGQPPVIYSINPTSGFGGNGTQGTAVTILGANFTQEPCTLKFNGVVANKWVQSDKQMIGYCPIGGEDGYITYTTVYGTCRSPVVFTDPPAPPCTSCDIVQSMLDFAALCVSNPRIGYGRCNLSTDGENFWGSTKTRFCCDCSSFVWLLRYWADGWKYGADPNGADTCSLHALGRSIGTNPSVAHSGDLVFFGNPCGSSAHVGMIAWSGGVKVYSQGGCGCCPNYDCACCSCYPLFHGGILPACSHPALKPVSWFGSVYDIRRMPGL